MGVLDKIFNTLTGLHFFIDTPTGGGSTTASAAIAKGATSFTLTSATSFAIGDDVRVGTGETMELIRISNLVSTTLTPAKPMKFDHASGEAVVEQSALSIGVPEADGFKVSFASEATDVFAATQRLAYGVIQGYTDYGASLRFPVITADALALALGIPRANVIGDGTAVPADGTVGPRLFTTDGLLFGGLTNVNVVATGTLVDGSYAKFEFYNASFDPTAVTTTFARGQLATIPVRFLASSGAWDFTNSVFTPKATILTYASSKADIFSEITAVQYFTAGTATTTTAGIAAGAYVIPVTSATGMAAGGWVQLGSGDLAEFHLIDAVSTLNLLLRTQVFRAHASGVACVAQTRTDFAGVTGGFTMAASGQVSNRRSETSRTSLAYKIGNVGVAFNFLANNIKPETVLKALGIPLSVYANSVIPIGNDIATDDAVTLLFTGLTQGGKVITICGWNGAATVGGEVTFSQAAEATIPLSYKPGVLQVLVNA